jgi:hypothetical protein
MDVKINKDGPIGILWAGDAHLDNKGCDFNAVERDCQIINETDGMFGAVLGDTVDGWVGRLTKLYANAGTTASEGFKLAEWYFGAAPWLFVLGGNHDQWTSSDALAAYAKQHRTIYEPHSLRMNLKLPSGHNVRCHARHQFPGSSQWNKAHALTKYQMLGTRDHIAVCGHLHVSAYNVLRDPTSGIAMHSVHVASYKVHDEYAVERGFIDQHLSPSAVTVVNTHLPESDPSFITVWWNPEEGADYLRFLRGRS